MLIMILVSLGGLTLLIKRDSSGFFLKSIKWGEYVHYRVHLNRYRFFFRLAFFNVKHIFLLNLSALVLPFTSVSGLLSASSNWGHTHCCIL